MVAHQKLRKRYIFTLFLIFLSTFCLIYLQSSSTLITSYFQAPASIQCYHSISEETLENIENVDVTPNSSIFFHETSCQSNERGKIMINARQACAVESAAKMNPEKDVYLLYTSPGVFQFEEEESDRFLQAILSYENVRILHVNFGSYLSDTPLQNLYENGKVEASKYPMSHASDILRYMTLWRYGGIYLDLDVIVTKSLTPLQMNFAGIESDDNVAAGVLSFSATDFGHDLAEECLNDLKANFRGHDWGYNGPGVITRLLRRVCNVKTAAEMAGKNCNGFKVYPPKSFYAVPWWNWTMFFDDSSTEEVLAGAERGFVAHVWNKHSASKKVPLKSTVPYVLLAQKYCPKVFAECEEFF